ncbi:hypothetical protein QYM36_000888 [Artemia franciscana]|uniref:Sas10 C-terminal domain-containing protein n=1 Tax=Artemia franciscana TaxID=6661 RepID=A0AA88IBL7_ARTSF|nr:hypothetical protein QYM36_000888 [Artemia franciscana]
MGKKNYKQKKELPSSVDNLDEEYIEADDLIFNSKFEKTAYERDEEVKYGKYRPIDSDKETEILGVADTSDEDDLPQKTKKKKKKKGIKMQTPAKDSDMDSDIADNASDGMPDSRAWGKKRSTYYSADYVDEDWGGMDGSDAEAAELEEQEAREIQKRMAETLDDADFGLEFFQTDELVKKVEKEVKSIVTKDIEKLSSKEKLDLVKKESPELLGLIEEYKSQIHILKEEIQPIMKAIKEGLLPISSGAEFVKLKFRLLMSFCTNLSFYFVLKSNRVPVKNHPVMKRLVQYKSLLKQLAPVEEKLRTDLDAILKSLKTGEKVKIKPKMVNKKTLKILSALSEEPAKEIKNSQKKNSELTADEVAAVELYNAIKSKKKVEMNSSEEEQELDGTKSEDDVENQEEEYTDEETGKRAITYQIAKNKGLMPARSKEQRNPRVKHRNKFRKATIRRKGAVRQVRSEVSRYGGEISGIKATVVKSVKFK